MRASQGVPIELESLPAIGKDALRRLRTAGIRSAQQLADAPLRDIIRAARVFPGEAALWQSIARLLWVPGLDPQVAEALAHVGVRDAASLAGQEPAALFQQIQADRGLVAVPLNEIRAAVGWARRLDDRAYRPASG